MIQNKFLLFKTAEAFNQERLEIKDDSIVFIEGETPIDRAIWTHGKFYSSTLGLEHSKGLFDSLSSLERVYPYPTAGDWAIVNDDWLFGKNFPVTLQDQENIWHIYICETDGIWKRTNRRYNLKDVDLSLYLRRDEINFNQYATKDDINLVGLNYLTKENANIIYATKELLDNQTNQILLLLLNKQNTLIDGLNIATINGASLLDGGDIKIEPTIINNITGSSIDTTNIVTKNQLLDYVKIEDIDDYVRLYQNNTNNFVEKDELNDYVKIENIDSYIDTSTFATKSELDDYVLKAILKTVNWETLIGPGNVEIQSASPVDMSGYITKEEFDSYNKILSVNITSISPTLFEYTGNGVNITCQYVVKKGADSVIPATLSINGNSIQPQSSGTFVIQHDTLGTKQIKIVATLGAEVASSTKSSTSVRPTYCLFSIESDANNLDLSNTDKIITGSISIQKTLENTVAGSYLWIVTQFDIQKVAVDLNFTYPVAMEQPIVIGGLKYYRSKQLIDKCELTYYIK